MVWRCIRIVTIPHTIGFFMIFFLFMHVCVNRLKRCKTSNLAIFQFIKLLCVLLNFAGEWSRPAELHLTKLSAVPGGYHWRRPATCLHSCDHLLFRVCFYPKPIILQSVRVHGQGDKPRTLTGHFFHFSLFHLCSISV